MKIKILFACCIFCNCHNLIGQQITPSAYSSTVKVNYIRTWSAKKPDTANSSFNTNPALTHSKMTTQYIDGLGRHIQTVAMKGSMITGSSPVDLVSPNVYDEFGRETFKYLPFAANNTGSNTHISDGLFKLNPFQQDSTFNKGLFSDESWYYSQTNFEASPLNRVTEAFAPGDSWVGTSGQSSEGNRRSVKMKYWSNTSGDDVKKWDVADVSNGWGTYTVSGAYAAGELYKTVTVDEHNKQVIEFTDKLGRIILKKVQISTASGSEDDGTGRGYTGWLCTYYLYDDLNNLRCVIQPEGVKTLSGASWSLTPTILNEQCFCYEYDERNRVTMKKVPGAGAVWNVYDARDRLVLTQDSNMRAAGKWMYTLYDELNRPTKTGLWTNSSDRVYHKGQASGGTAYPNLSGQTYEELTVTFYDGYSWLSTYSSPLPSSYDNTYDTYFQTASNSNWPYPQANNSSAMLKGLITGSRIKILGTSDYLYTVSFYDDKGRVIQTQSTNIAGGVDIVTTQYSWAGQPLVTILKQQKTGTNAQTSIIVTQNTYDDLGRLVKIEKKQKNTFVNSNAMSSYKTILENEYNHLGQLKKKKLAPAYNSNDGIETQNFDYNIRGWMLGVNRSYVGTTGQNGTTKFGFDLGYDKQANSSGRNYSVQQFTANISGIVWKSDGDDVKRKYDFGYDVAGRLLQGLFEQEDGTNSWNSTTMNYKIQIGDGSDPTTAYDNNGNIKAMKQFGWKLGGSNTTPIDDLSYNYISGSNQLLNVIDANNDAQTKLGDFRTSSLHPTPSKTSSTVDYTYDGNGNMLRDYNKDIGNSSNNGVVYNHLNLPQTITVRTTAGAVKGTISYTYDAGGNKLQKTVEEVGQSTKTTLYVSGAVYENDVLQFIAHEEGRMRPSSSAFNYDYFLKDYLGNVRMVLTEEAKTDKYPVASLEDSKVNTEDDYYTIDATKIVSASSLASPPSNYTNDNGIGNNPSDPTFEGTNSAKLYKLNGNTNKIGLSITLKVMAGDKIDIHGKSYWFDNNTGGSSANSAPVVLDLLTAMMGAPTSATTAGHTNATELNGISEVTSPVSSFIGNSDRNNSSYPQRPKAFINYIFFNEQFQYVNGGFSAVNNTSALKSHFSELQNLTASKNGYVYIYVSNESPVNVFFDNLQVVHVRGSLVEETHYYPFGLTMGGISSKALIFGEPKNKYGFNGIESNFNLDLNLYDAFYRNLDPQIGRFLQIDPKTNWVESPYVSMGNNPVKNTDWLGDYFRWANQTVQSTYLNLREENNKRIEGYMKEIVELGDLTDEKAQKKVKQLEGLINAHADLNSQWDQMENSNVEFYVSSGMPDKGAAADTKFINNRVEIRMGKSEKNIATMAHEFRHGYGFLNGEMIAGGSGLYDMTDEVVAYNAGYLFLDRGTANLVVDGYYNVDWFKKSHLNAEPYKHLSGKETSITLNTPAAVYLKYFDDRLARFMHQGMKNNANMTVKDAIDAANAFSQQLKRGNEFRYGEEMLKNRN